MNSELRPHQQQALAALRLSLGMGKRRPMMQAPTGFGKTILAAAIVDGALRKGNRVTFVVPALSLIDQTVESFWREGIRDVGVIQASHEMTNPNRPVQVASVQTLQRRAIPQSEIVVIDEAHRWFDFYGTWMGMDEWKRIPFVGLSATPWTRGLGKHFDDLIIAATTTDLIEAGYLSRFRVFAPSHPDLSGVRTVAGDYHEGDLSGAMDKPTLTADVVDTWRRIGEDRPTFVFAVDRAHARHLRDRFGEAGISTAYVDAFTTADERDAIRRQFHSGEVRVVCNVGCLTTGVDWDVRCIVLARPTKSQMLYVQMIGRGLRTADGKSDCLVLDHSDTTLRLGFVTDIHHTRLDDGRKDKNQSTREKSAPLPKECTSCSFLKPAGVSKCPSCGFQPQKLTAVEVEDGNLVELKPKHKPDEKRAFYAQLKGYAVQHGKSDSWVLANYRAKFSEWPHRKDIAPIEPGPEVIGWIRHRQIAWAKSKRSVAA